MRLLFVALEPVVGHQVAPRQAFEFLLRKGDLSDLLVFPFYYGKPAESRMAIADLYEKASLFQPDIIVWQTLKQFPVTYEFLQSIKSLHSEPTLVYCEEDAWGGFHKRLTRPMKALARSADLLYLHGLGDLSRLFRNAGAKDIRYFPFYADTVRFGKPWRPAQDRPYDAVMIGGYYRSRFPLVPGLPGSAQRYELARRLGQTFGTRFGLFGAHWPSWPFAKGPLPYDQQEQACRQGWISVNWDHYDLLPFYFSDRLPIAMLAGVPHVTTYHPGYESIFPPDAGIFFAKSPAELAELALFMMSKPKRELIDLGAKAACFAREHLTATVVWTTAMQTIIQHRISRHPGICEYAAG